MEAEKIYSLDWTNSVKPVGRVFVYNDVLWMSFSGTGISFEARDGFSAVLVADSMISAEDADIHYARFAVLEDGNVVLDERLTTAEKKIEIKAEGVHSYAIVKLSESNDSSMGILSISGIGKDAADSADEITPAPAKKLKMEFVGDSITCGYGVEGDLEHPYSTATENAGLAWAYLSAAGVGADYSIISKSGAGLISGYTGTGDRNTDNIITGYYDRMGCSMSSIAQDVKPQDFEYDFAFEPDFVIINLGTNDISFCHPVDEKGAARLTAEEETARRQEFYQEYKKFVLHVREVNPFAKIVCILGVMGTALNGEVEMAVKELQAAGDSRIFWCPLEDQNPDDGYGTDYHPSKYTQSMLAEKIVGLVEEIR